MNDREKLKELLPEARRRAAEICHERDSCNECQYWDDRPYCRSSHVADHLLANGVIVLPCKPGNAVYWLVYNRDACGDCDAYSSFYGMDAMCDYHYELWPEIIDPSNDEEHCPKHFIEIIEYKSTLECIVYHRNEFGKTIFLTREEAEAALAELSKEDAE